MSLKLESIKRHILSKKINSYFTKNPMQESVVIQAKINGRKYYWHIVKENNQFVATEVNTHKEAFSIPGLSNLFAKKNWDPQNPESEFNKMVSSGADLKTVMSKMPQDQLRKYFGLPQSALQSPKFNVALAKKLGMKSKEYPGMPRVGTTVEPPTPQSVPVPNVQPSQGLEKERDITKNIRRPQVSEAPVGGQQPAMPMTTPTGQQMQQPAGATQAKRANMQQFSQLDVPTKIAQLSSGMMLNYDTVVSTLASIVKDKSQDIVQLRRAIESGLNLSNADSRQKQLVGQVLGLLTSLSNEKGLMSSVDTKGKPKLKENK